MNGIDTLSRTQQISTLIEVNERLETIQGLPAIEDGMLLSGGTRPAKDNYHSLGNPTSSPTQLQPLSPRVGGLVGILNRYPWLGTYRPGSEPTPDGGIRKLAVRKTRNQQGCGASAAWNATTLGHDQPMQIRCHSRHGNWNRQYSWLGFRSAWRYLLRILPVMNGVCSMASLQFRSEREELPILKCYPPHNAIGTHGLRALWHSSNDQRRACP